MVQTTEVEKAKIVIPEITDEKLAELCQRIKPLFRFEKGGLCYIKSVDPRSVAFTWGPKPDEQATGLEPIGDITTYHTWAYYGFFKPSIAEVIAQIPQEYFDQVVAFEIVESPETTDDLNAHLDELNQGFHVAKTRLYAKAA